MPAVRVSYEGDPVEAQKLLGKARQELARLESRLETTGLEFGKFLIGFPNTSNYCYGHALPGGLRQLHIIAPTTATSPFEFEETEVSLPDFLSGWAIDGRYDANPETNVQEVRDFRPTNACVSLHSDEVTAGPNRVARLAIDVGPGFSDYFPDRGPWPRSQVDKLYPTAYSGTMVEWVQIMLGFGKKREPTSIYDDVEPLIDEDLTAETKWEQTLADEGMRVWYDFRFQRTHGIHWAADGKPWLVEISMNRGVVAMPLPLDDRTTSPEFYEKLVNKGDIDAQRVVDKFGGFPSGEPFPSSAELWDAFVRAGRIIQLAPYERATEFYQNLHYSSAMGWAFNERGDEAHNTAYRYGDDGVQIGVHYAVQMQIGATNTPPAPEEANELRGMLSSLRATKGTWEAVSWKLDRFTKEQCDTYMLRLNDEATEAIYNEIDELEMSPLASGSGSFTKAGEGFLWWPSPFQPQIKFYEPQLGYLLSHDLRPDQPNAPRNKFCDTTVHVFFVGNELKWAKYYRDNREIPEGGYSGDSQFEFQNTPVGTKYMEYTRGPIGVAAQYYSNDIDPREELPERTDKFWMRGTDKGYYLWIFSVDHWTVPFVPNYGNGDLFHVRHKKFLKEFDSYYDFYRRRGGAVVVPAWFRECMFVADKWQEHYRSSHHGWGWQGVIDPNGGFEAVGDGDRKVDELLYSMFPTELYEYTKSYADEGPWLSIGDEVIFRGNANEIAGENAGDSWFGPEVDNANITVTFIGNSPFSPKVVINRDYTGYDAAVLQTLWFLPSPYPDTGDTQYHHATKNGSGDSECLVYLEDINGQKNVTLGYPQDSAFETRLPIFVGVV